MDMDGSVICSVFSIQHPKNGSVRFQLKSPKSPRCRCAVGHNIPALHRLKKESRNMNSIEEELIEAAKENNLPEVSRILRAGADVDATDKDNDSNNWDYNWTSLHWASRMGHMQVFNELLKHGADIEAREIDGNTPLHLACQFGHLAVGNELLSRGADVDAKNCVGSTPLHLACTNEHLAVVKALLSSGANILAANKYEQLPIHYAVRNGHSAEVAKYLLQISYATTHRLPLHELMEDLTWIGNPISNGSPPLRYALHRNVLGTGDVVGILEYLVGQNPEMLKSRDKDGSIPLHLACQRGASFTIVQSLVDLYKASVKSLTPGGDLPLFLACEMPATSLDTIFILMKLYPDLVYR
jgi:ankyrin repeat protein